MYVPHMKFILNFLKIKKLFISSPPSPSKQFGSASEFFRLGRTRGGVILMSPLHTDTIQHMAYHNS